jgi:hypothetical protein
MKAAIDAMLLFLRTPLKDAVTFCAFQKILDPTMAENARRKQRPVCERK